MGEHVYAIVQDSEQVARLKSLGADGIYVLEKTSTLQRIENYAETLADILKEVNGEQTPALVLMAATKRGKALTARLGCY